MAKIRKKRVRWSASLSPDVAGYKLYWALLKGVSYDSASVNVGNVTEIILPDNVPSFPLLAGDVEFGVTAVDQSGNESDMAVYSTNIDFVAPDPPKDLVLEDI